jgi:hypothetical protein
MMCLRVQSCGPFYSLPLIFQVVNFVLYADNINILVVGKQKEEEERRHKVALIMQQLGIWYWINDLIVYSVQYNLIATKTDILVDLASYLIEMKLHSVQN